MNPRHRRQAVVLQRLFRHDENRAGAVAYLAAGGRGNLTLRAEQLDSRDAIERRIEADALIDRVAFLALGRIDLDTDDFPVECARLGGLNRFLMTGKGEAIKIVLRKTVLLRNHLGTHELAPLDAGIFLLQTRRLVVTQALLHVEHGGRTHRHPAHAFDACCDHDILRTAHHRLRGELDRLLAGAALAIDRDRRNTLAQML